MTDFGHLSVRMGKIATTVNNHIGDDLEESFSLVSSYLMNRPWWSVSCEEVSGVPGVNQLRQLGEWYTTRSGS